MEIENVVYRWAFHASFLCSWVVGVILHVYVSMPVQRKKMLESLRAQFFWGAEEGSRKIHWVAWDLVIAPKDQGGVGIASLECFNYALLQKWRWRFLTEPNSLWRKVIIALHGNCSHPHFGRSSPGNGVWGRIMKSWDIMNDKDVIPYSMALRKIGDGNSTAF